MSLIDTKSTPVAKQELALFSIPPTQIAVIRNYSLFYYNRNQLDGNAPVCFDIAGSPHYTDVSATLLRMKFKITRANGGNLQAGDNVAPICGIVNSMWSQIKLYVGGRLLWDSQDTYSYKAHIQTLLGFSKQAKETHLRAGLYIEDTAGNMDATNPAVNTGFSERQQEIAGSVVREVVGLLHIDVFNQNKLWPSHVPLTLELYKNRTRFVVHSDGQNNYKIQLTDIRLEVQMVECAPSVTIALEKQLLKQGAKYPIRRTSIKIIHVNQNRRDIPQTLLHSGPIPRRIVCFMTTTDAYHGEYASTPFNFQHFDVHRIQIVAGGIEYPNEPLEMDFQNGNASDAYMALHRAFQSEDGTPVTITPAQFRQGYSLFCFELTQDHSGSHSHYNVTRYGNVELRIEFANPIGQATGIKIFCLMEFDGCLTLDKNRQFYLDNQTL